MAWLGSVCLGGHEVQRATLSSTWPVGVVCLLINPYGSQTTRSTPIPLALAFTAWLLRFGLRLGFSLALLGGDHRAAPVAVVMAPPSSTEGEGVDPVEAEVLTHMPTVK